MPMDLDIMMLVIGCQLRLKEVPPSIYGDATYGQLVFAFMHIWQRSFRRFRIGFRFRIEYDRVSFDLRALMNQFLPHHTASSTDGV